MDEPKKKKLHYFDYDQIVSISFGSTKVVYRTYSLRKENWERYGSNLAICLFHGDLFESYDGNDISLFSSNAEHEARCNRDLYINRLSDKVEYLFATEPNIKKPLKQAKDRLYQRAVVLFFKNLIEDILNRYNMVSSKGRYLMTYPTHWTLEQAAYLRSLLQMAGIVSEHDHPDRLIMFNESEAIVRYIQSPRSNFPNITEGQKYMICDLSGIKVEMHLFDIKGPINYRSLIKTSSRCNWYNGFIKKPGHMYLTEGDFYPETMSYLSSLLSTPSIYITIVDLEENITLLRGLDIESLKEVDVKRNTSIFYDIPQSLRDLYREKLNNKNKLSTEPLPQWVEDGYIELNPREIKEKILKPVCNRIIEYIKKIIETITDIFEGVILVSNEDEAYVINLIADEYKEITKKEIYKINKNDVIKGAVLKCLDNLTEFDIDKPKILLDDLDLSAASGIGNTQDVIVLIDYGLEKTRVSYIHAQPGQIASDANIKHIMDWPGQSTLSRDFPTLNAILIPNYPLDIGEDSRINLWKKCNLFGNLSPQNSKAILVLEEKVDYNQEISTLAKTIFYTFEKDEQGIILVTHQRKVVEELLIATTTANSVPASCKETRERISFQEFSLLYFEYLADFLHSYIYSKTGVEKEKHRYCITHDIQGYSEKFTLSKKNIRRIALESLADIPTNLLVLDRAEAVAIHCRKLVDTTMANDEEAHLYFLQVQLHPDRCLLILNSVPFLDDEDSNSYREDGKPWECVHKYAKTKNTLINFMDIISENLWIHMQKIGGLLLRKCEHHQAQKQFFNSKNMQTTKKMFYDYISSTKDLNLEYSEKEHTIYICDKDSGSCCYLVTTNMDLLEFAFNPAIYQLVSIIQSSIFNQNLFRGIQISDIFVLGEFLNCQDHVSYKFLEDLLFEKLRNIHFPQFDNIILQSMTKKTQVKKLGVREHQQGQDGGIEVRHDSLAQISSSGSVIFSIDPRNLLVERSAARTYIIQLGYVSNKKIVYNHLSRAFKGGGSFHIIISKGTPLKSLSSIDNTISKHFMITEYDEEDYFTDIILFATEDDASFLTDACIDENSWRDKVRSTSFEYLKTFSIFDIKFNDPLYPFSFKFHLSQTETYKFWIEKGKNSKAYIDNICEPILLKSCHHE